MSGQPPRISLITLRQRRADVEEVFQRYIDTPIDVVLARRLAMELSSFSDGQLPFDLMFDSMAQYVGRVLDQVLIDILSMQVAGRFKEAKTSVLKAFTYPERSEWVPLEITHTAPYAWRGRYPGTALTLYAWGGQPAGHSLVKQVPDSWLRYLAYVIGFSKRWRYEDEPWALRGLMMWGYLVPDEEATALNFEKWEMSKQMKSTNTAMVRRRMRFQARKEIPEDALCPFDYDHSCCECEKRRTECLAAIYP